MKFHVLKKTAVFSMAAVLGLSTLAGCGGGDSDSTKGADKNDGKGSTDEVVELKWYMIGGEPKDKDLVFEKVNEYTKEKIGVTINPVFVGFGDYSQKMQITINSGDDYDLCFSCSWANDYLQNARKESFLALDDYLPEYGKDMYESIDKRFWEAAQVNGVTYGVPSEKEIASMPMWVFTKELVDKYDIPYEDIHDLEDLEPYLKLIKEKEPEYTPLYLTKDFSVPIYMDLIADPVGIEFGDDSLTVKNLYETDKLKETVETMRKYYEAGYINKDAATASDDKGVKRFVTKGDGQPYAETTWSKDLGYEVVTSEIMDAQVTNTSARGALTAINARTEHPEKCVELLNLVNTDEYLRNLLNYGIEDVHWEKQELTDEEKEEADGVYDADFKVAFTDQRENYSVTYWSIGGLFNTYVMSTDPVTKWQVFKDFNAEAVNAPSWGFDFDSTDVATEISGFGNVKSEFAASLFTGSVDPEETLEKLNAKLEAAGIQTVIDEMQSQIDEWKKTKEDDSDKDDDKKETKDSKKDDEKTTEDEEDK